MVSRIQVDVSHGGVLPVHTWLRYGVDPASRYLHRAARGRRVVLNDGYGRRSQTVRAGRDRLRRGAAASSARDAWRSRHAASTPLRGGSRSRRASPDVGARADGSGEYPLAGGNKVAVRLLLCNRERREARGRNPGRERYVPGLVERADWDQGCRRSSSSTPRNSGRPRSEVNRWPTAQSANRSSSLSAPPSRG
jgi:hypothetical protein